MENTRNLKSQRPQTRRLSRIERNKRDLVTWNKKHDDVLPLLESLLLDIKTILPSYGSADFTHDLVTLRRRFKAEGVSFATKTLPQLVTGLFGYLENGISVYPGFRLSPGCEYPAFLRQAFAPIYNVDTSEEDRAKYIDMIYQFGVAFKKIKGPYPISVLTDQLRDFVSVDEELGNKKVLCRANGPILKHARAIVTSIFKDIDPYESRHARPRPGPGATNTPVGKHMRYEPHVLYTQIDNVLPYDEWFYNSPWHVVERAREYLSLVKDRIHEPRSRFKFVNKEFGKARGICIEENEMQWFQQAIKNLFYHVLEKHPETRGRVNFTSQNVNRRLALYHSRSRRYATLDMKEASDRIPRRLVSYLFSGCKDLRRILEALSTRYIDFPKKDIDIGLDFIRTNKYAPMGSGLCFPVMAMVHYALIKAIILNSAIPKRFMHSKRVFVYGDDIIVPVECVQAIYDWLPQFGMKFNVSKSFHTSHFRESCGVHAYYGKDITPVYFRNIPTSSRRTENLLSAIGTEYGLYKKGLYNTASRLRSLTTSVHGPLPLIGRLSNIHMSEQLLKKFGTTLQIDSSGAAPLGWIRDGRTRKEHIITYAQRVRRSKRYQAPEYKLRVVVATNEKLPPLSEDSGYLRSLVTHSRDASSVGGSCERLAVVYKWIQESAL